MTALDTLIECAKNRRLAEIRDTPERRASRVGQLVLNAHESEKVELRELKGEHISDLRPSELWFV